MNPRKRLFNQIDNLPNIQLIEPSLSDWNNSAPSIVTEPETVDLSSDSDEEIIIDRFITASTNIVQNKNLGLPKSYFHQLNYPTQTFLPEHDLESTSLKPETELPVLNTDSDFCTGNFETLNSIEQENSESVENEHEVYEVEKIISINQNKYLLKWKGWAYRDSTWENKRSLCCPEITSAFKIRQKVAEKLYDSCSPLERQFYYYEPKEQIYRIPQLLMLHIWEDALNRVCQRANIAPIYVENWYDNERAPPNFEFIQQNVFHESAIEICCPLKNQYKCDCQMYEYCQRDQCCSRGANVRFPYLNNKLISAYDKIIECHAECRCDRYCPARLVQRGRQVPIVLFRTEGQGWSVRAATYIAQGAFVMAYIGEVISREEVKKRGDLTSFMFDVDCANIDQAIFTVDAIRLGNEARWVNHSCDPNMKTYGVVIDRYENYETLAFFAVKNIFVGEELTIDYFAHVTETLVDGVKCLCKSTKCRGFLMD